ncbi:MAG: DUF1549 domain-containing protein, partial [Planctomycetes bacterium]|nr:DUF1549 domain-containing protein [Planctomycetota bacterium]
MPPRIVTIFLIALAFPSIALSDDVVDYLRDIKPLLKSRCYSCHGGLKQKSGLRVDTVSSLLKGSESGLVVNQSEIDKSPLLERIASTNADIRMPPEHEGEPLSASQVDLIRRWIIQGASGPADESPDADPREHWAFKQRSRPTIPDQHRLMDKSVAWDRNPIDSFVATVHQRHGLTPQSEAGRLIMVRRLYVDLIGLPPST